MKISKIEIARRQLELASDLYFSGGDHVSVITLSGAAEEILGTLLKNSGGINMLRKLVELDKEVNGERKFQTIKDELNKVRNSIKHANDSSEEYVNIESHEAMAMLGRAVFNYIKLTGTYTTPTHKVYLHLVEYCALHNR